MDRRTPLARWRVRLGFAVAVITVVLAAPTGRTLAIGAAIACVGEALRVWAAGHLEKGREVTTSGPYRLTRHPLYVGSAIMGVGVVVAANHPVVAGCVLAYLATTLTAAMRNEEAHLREQFGTAYDEYARGAAPTVRRAFSVARAWRNREYRSAIGLALMVAVLAAKVTW